MPVNNLLPPLPLSDRPLYATLVQFPAVCFVGTLLTDLAYWRTDLYLWETFSVWLLTAGCVLAGITGIVGLVEFIRDRRARAWRWAWPQALLSLIAALLSVVNAFVHSRDGYTAVVPDGITLSAIVVVLMAVVVWMGWNHTHRDLRIGVTA